MVAMRLLKDDPWESLLGELLLVHVSLHEALFKELIGGLNPFPSEAFLESRVRRHFLHVASKGLGSDLLSEAAT